MSEQSKQVASKVIQQGILHLAQWVEVELPYGPVAGDEEAIYQAKKLLSWPLETAEERIEPQPLQIIFDTIKLINSATEKHFWPVKEISNQDPNIPYPGKTVNLRELDVLKGKIKTELENLTPDDWENTPLLVLILEKYGASISYGESDVAFFDLIKMTAAVAAALADAPEAEKLSLVAGNLSGIQDFIYTIASAGALKSLRARSFLLELVTEEVVQQLLGHLKLPRTNVIYAGGGNVYLLAPNTKAVSDGVAHVWNQANVWLLDKFQGKVFLGLVNHAFPTKEINTPLFAQHWENTIKQLTQQKNRKFYNQIEQLLAEDKAYEPCKVCHRDDVETLKPLNPQEPSSVGACCTCRQMFALGQQLFNVGAIVRTEEANLSHAELIGSIDIKIGEETIYYHFFKGTKPYLENPRDTYFINNWDVALQKQKFYKNPTPLLLGNYGQESMDEKGTFITASELANQSEGIQRVGYLRMDVDRLGQIFANGLGNNYTLPRLSGLSRQMSYFFKVYLNSLAEFRQREFLAVANPNHFQTLTQKDRKNLLFIYAGGDDLFVSGAWNEIVEFAFDVYQSFRAYTGWHPDITLSAGISLSGPKYPLYQSAADAEKAEGAAKKNGRDSFTLFDQTFKWQEWLGHTETSVSEISTITPELRQYLGSDIMLELHGIFPFVTRLDQAFQTSVPRSFIRNLLTTAQLQEQQVKTAKEKNPHQAQAIRYFLHLPKVAYMLARLPKSVRAAPGLDAVSSSLKSPYNALYFRAIATWLDLLNRSSKQTKVNDDY